MCDLRLSRGNECLFLEGLVRLAGYRFDRNSSAGTFEVYYRRWHNFDGAAIKCFLPFRQIKRG